MSIMYEYVGRGLYTMKKIMIYIIIFAIILNGAIVFATPATNDIENHWSQRFVEWAINEAYLMERDEEGDFRPNENITRGDFITALNNLLYYRKLFDDIDIAEFTYDVPYKDVSVDDVVFYSVIDLYNYINFHTNTGIVFEDVFQGETLNVAKYITRKEAMLLARAVTTPPIFTKEIEFSDLDENSIHADKIYELINNGIINGYGDNTLRLYRNLTRAETAVILKRVYEDMHYLVHDYLSFKQISKSLLTNMIVSSYVEDDLITSLSRQRFINAAITLDYIKFVGHIPFQERHLYDMDAIGTLWDLRKEEFEDVIGINYYLIAHSENMEADRKIQLIRESLQHLSLTLPADVQGLFRFLEIAEKHIPKDEIISFIESFYFSSEASETKFKAGIYMTEYYFENGSIENALFIYDELLGFDNNIDRTIKLIRNFAVLKNEHLGKEETVNILKAIWNSKKETEMYELHKKDIDGIFTGLLKQLLLQTDESLVTPDF